MSRLAARICPFISCLMSNVVFALSIAMFVGCCRIINVTESAILIELIWMNVLFQINSRLFKAMKLTPMNTIFAILNITFQVPIQKWNICHLKKEKNGKNPLRRKGNKGELPMQKNKK